MRLPLALLLCLLAPLLAGCPVWQSQDTPVSQMRLRDPASQENYWIYVPSDYDARRDWPMVVTLHGTVPFDHADAQIREWKALAEDEGLIVIAPVLESPQGILPTGIDRRMEALARDEQVILGAIDDACGRYSIDPESIVLSGFSAGGFPMYYTGLRHPQRFAALAARACNSDVRVLDRIELTDQARALPVVIIHGKSDLGPIGEQSWAAFRWLRRRGFRLAEHIKMEGGHIRIPGAAWMHVRSYVRANPRNR